MNAQNTGTHPVPGANEDFPHRNDCAHGGGRSHACKGLGESGKGSERLLEASENRVGAGLEWQLQSSPASNGECVRDLRVGLSEPCAGRPGRNGRGIEQLTRSIDHPTKE